jgi:hypothetical protein
MPISTNASVTTWLAFSYKFLAVTVTFRDRNRLDTADPQPSPAR